MASNPHIQVDASVAAQEKVMRNISLAEQIEYVRSLGCRLSLYEAQKLSAQKSQEAPPLS